MKERRSRKRRFGLLVAASLSGGSLLQTCETRFRDAVVSGTRGYISSLLDPTNVLQALIEDSTDATTGP